MANLNVKKVYMMILMLFPITTLFQSYLGIINKLLFGLVILLQLYILSKDKIKLGHFLIILFLALNHVWALVNTNFPLFSSNDLFYFFFWVIYSIFIVNNMNFVKQFFQKEQNYILLVIKLWTFFVSLSIFLPNSYNSEAGSITKYFTSFTDTSFRLAPTALCIMIFTLAAMVFYDNKKYIIYCAVPLFCFFMGSSRTYLGISMLLFIIIWYMYCPKKSTFYLTVIPIVIIATSLVSISAMQNKIESVRYSSDSYFDFWGTITNSRTVFWKSDLEAFVEQNLFKQLFGNGFNFVYEVNKLSVGVYIWGHNDFIQVLTTFGFIGLLTYLYSIRMLFSKITINSKKVPTLLIFLIFGIWLINAFFNMMYTYICAAISLPILVLTIEYAYENKKSHIDLRDKQNG